MAMTVVLDVPYRTRTSPAGPVLGAGLIAIGLVALVPAFVLTFIGWLALSDNATPHVPSRLSLDFAVIWVADIGTAVLALSVGVALLRRNRRLVLFLRRFGYTAATRAATVAAATIGARWRIVTLDDAQLAPIGVGRFTDIVAASRRGGVSVRRIYSGAARTVRTVLVLCVVAACVDIGVAAARGDDISTVFSGDHATTAAAVLRVIFAVAVLAAGLGLVGAALAALRLLMFPAWVAGVSVARAVRAAEDAKSLEVPDAPAIVTARDRVKRLSRHVFSPRLFVLRVNSAVWQLAVNGLASVADLPLIDISEPTENVLWEIEQLVARFGPRCVLVAEYQQAVQLTAPGSVDPTARRVQHLLDGRTVLAYIADDAGTHRFATALRAMVEQSLRTPLPGPPPADALPRQLVIDARRDALRARRQARRNAGNPSAGRRD